MDFLKNIQDQFQAMIEDVNHHSAENVNKIMHQIEQAKQYHHFVYVQLRFGACCLLNQHRNTSHTFLIRNPLVIEQSVLKCKIKSRAMPCPYKMKPSREGNKLRNGSQHWLGRCSHWDKNSRQSRMMLHVYRKTLFKLLLMFIKPGYTQWYVWRMTGVWMAQWILG